MTISRVIVGFRDEVDVMNSLQRPKKIGIIGSDGKTYPFLCKPKDDLRKDCRVLEFYSLINKLLQRNPETRRRHLCMLRHHLWQF
jgi:serine/threonine-protein kinase ATR